MYYQSRIKKNRKILKSITKIGLLSFGLFTLLNLNNIQSTSSFFGDFEEMENKFTAGYWIPTLTMSVDKTPDEDGSYDETPCVTLSADINGETSGITIYYKFANDGNPVSDGEVYDGVCVPIPDGNPSYFEAQAVNNENQNWVSNLISTSFNVDTLSLKPGDVIINEVMWMGSQNDDGALAKADEWLELRNTTNHDIDIKNWNIYGTKKSGHYEIAGGSEVIIPANGYFLITDRPKDDSRIDVEPDRFIGSNIDFENNYAEHGRIILESKAGVVIDQTPALTSNWPAGKNENHMRWSMERNVDEPGDGTEDSDWHTCDPTIMEEDDLETMQSYWDEDARKYNCGTPGNENLSKNDPTAPDYEEELESFSAELTPPQSTELLVGNIEAIRVENPVKVQPTETIEEIKKDEKAPEIIEEEPVMEEPVIEEVKPVEEKEPVKEEVETKEPESSENEIKEDKKEEKDAEKLAAEDAAKEEEEKEAKDKEEAKEEAEKEEELKKEEEEAEEKKEAAEKEAEAKEAEEKAKKEEEKKKEDELKKAEEKKEAEIKKAKEEAVKEEDEVKKEEEEDEEE